MDWAPTTQQKMLNMLEAAVPEQFRDIALDGLQTDAEKYARARSASLIEDQDLVKAISEAPGFIQPELLNALKRMDVEIEASNP